MNTVLLAVLFVGGAIGAALGANTINDLKLVQSQFQWNQRTSLLATAIKEVKDPG